MKSVETVKNSIIANKGYYYKRDEIPDVDSPDVDFILKAEANETLDRIERRIKTIENCIIFFTVLQVVSIIASIILMIKVMSAF